MEKYTHYSNSTSLYIQHSDYYHHHHHHHHHHYHYYYIRGLTQSLGARAMHPMHTGDFGHGNSKGEARGGGRHKNNSSIYVILLASHSIPNNV